MKKVRSKSEVPTASRRRFLTTVGSATALSAIGIRVVAADLPKLDESEPSAVAFKYVHDASTVAESVRAQKDRYCYNCSLYAGSEEDEWAACAIFPGKAVAGQGWCSVWAPK